MVLSAILVIAALFRLWMAWDNPTTGDEVTSVLNATVYRESYLDQITYTARPVAEYQRMLTYTGENGIEPLIQRFIDNSRGHPPFYYVLLHGIVRFVGSHLMILRMVSIIASLLSIFFVYRIAQSLSNETTAQLAALLMAIAPFPVFYAMMMRPYPLATALALGTTAMVFRFIDQDTFQLKNWRVYLFSILSALGLFTIYHYGLTLAFQFTLLLFAQRFSKKHFATLFITGGLVILFLTPWISIMVSHVGVVRADSAPHSGPNESLWIVMKTLVYMNFGYFMNLPEITHEGPPFLVRAIRAGLFLLSFLLMAFGFSKLWPNRKKWPLLAAIAAYYATNFSLDLVSNIHSLSMEKLQFLPAAFSLIFIAAAIERPLSIAQRKITWWPIVLIIFIPGTLHICAAKPRYEDPFTLLEMQDQVKEHTTDDTPFLFVCNNHGERQFFTAVSILPSHGDFLLFRRKFFPDNLSELAELDKYETIFFINFYARGFDTYVFTVDELKQISASLDEVGFYLAQPIEVNEINSVDHLLIYKRETAQID